MTTTEPTQDQRDALAYIRGVLDTYGLGSEADWAWSQIVAGVGQTQLLQALRERDAYKARFQGMELRREEGLSAISEGEYVAYERQAYQLMLAADMPAEFRTPEYFARLIGQDRSINELSSSIINAYLAVTQAPPSVRGAYGEYFGRSADSAFAAMILDGEYSGAALERMAQEAIVGGTGTNFGFDVGFGLAEAIVQRGLGAQAPRAFSQAADQRMLAVETIGEANEADLTNDDIVESAFDLDVAAKERVRRRAEERAADFGGRDATLLTQQGAIGLGSAGR